MKSLELNGLLIRILRLKVGMFITSKKTHSKITELLGKGVLVKPSSPEFTYSKLADKRVDMLAKAAKDARIRAEAIALQAGSEVGGLKKVNTGVFR